MINAKTVTFASFGVNFSGKESMYILHPQKPELMRELTSSAVGLFDNPNLIREGRPTSPSLLHTSPRHRKARVSSK